MNALHHRSAPSVPDPHRWLEDVESREVQAWARDQNARARRLLDRLPGRPALAKRLAELWDYPRTDVPLRRSGRLFYFHNSGLQNQPVLYVRDGPEAEPRILLDPNPLSRDGTVAVTGIGLSRDGTLLAYALSTHGSDWQQVRIRDVNTGRDRDEVLRWVRFTELAFTADGQALYYSRYPAPGTVPPGDEQYYQRLCLHRLGEPQERDRLVYERPEDKDLGVSAEVSHHGRYLLITVWNGTDKNTELYFQRLDAADDAPIQPLATGFDARYEPIGVAGDTLYLATDLDAPRGRIVAVDLQDPEREAWTSIVPQGPDIFHQAVVAGPRLVVSWMHRATHRLRLYELDGRPAGTLPLPAPGSVDRLRGRPDRDEIFFDFTSFLHPTRVYRARPGTGELRLWREPPRTFDPGAYTTRQVFYESRDETLVSMFLVHRKGLRLDGGNPTFLYGYGGFNVSLTPHFSPSNFAWIEAGGVLAVPNLRGGGEYGEEWHRAGMLERKQTVFDDALAAAEWLIENGYTSPRHLGIGGRSNGGLLAAACLVQRPELFGAALVGVPVTDMLRYHLWTIGRYWIPEFGCADEPEHLRFLLAYSPLHNVRDATAYPPTLVETADTDDRVYPAHAFKFAARLQEAQAGEAPVLLRVEQRAGHGAGKPTRKLIQEAADVWAFLGHHLGVEMGAQENRES